MRHVDPHVGFSFELPDSWQWRRNILPLTFTSDSGTIQVKASDILPPYRTPEARRAFMEEPDLKLQLGAMLGDETENVLCMMHTTRNEGWLSAVRIDVHYEITWDHDERSEQRDAIKVLVSTFTFPASETAQAAVNAARSLTPEQAMSAKLLGLSGTPPTSVEEAKVIMQEAGMQPEWRGASGVAYGFQKAAPRKWWKFWR